MSAYSFICNVCQNYETDKCKECNGQGRDWVSTEEEKYNKDPNEYMKRLIIACDRK